VTTVPDIPVVELPAFDAGIADETALTPPASVWSVDVASARWLSPVALAALGVAAGVAAMILGAAAVISAGAGASPDATPVAPVSAKNPPTQPGTPSAERSALALLAKPSTERIAFRGAQGLVLAVGSGGRAAILLRGLEPAPADAPYSAWIVRPGAVPVAAARFDGTERAVFLTRPLGPVASVVLSAVRPSAGPPARIRIVALRS
jgi:hypothetical protein